MESRGKNSSQQYQAGCCDQNLLLAVLSLTIFYFFFSDDTAGSLLPSILKLFQSYPKTAHLSFVQLLLSSVLFSFCLLYLCAVFTDSFPHLMFTLDDPVTPRYQPKILETPQLIPFPDPLSHQLSVVQESPDFSP